MPASLTWTEEEDGMLRDLVQQYGTKAWAKIASVMKSKGSKQCRWRWKNAMAMSAKTCSWSPEEDAILVDAHRRLGNKWTEISKIFGDRTDNAVKNRWHALARKHPSLERGGAESDGAARRKRRRTARVASGDDDSDLPSRYGSQSMQYTNSGGVSAAALPTPFDQPGGSAAAHHMALHRQQAAQYAGVAGLPQHDAYAVSLAAAAAAQQAGYLQYPPPQVQAPLQIMVTKDFLTPWEQQLAGQINAMNLPVHVEVAPASALPIAPESLLPESMTAPELLAGRSSWMQYVEKLDEPGDSKGLQELLDWFGSNPDAPQPQQGPPAAASALGGRRLTRSLSKSMSGPASGSGSLSGDHRDLLVKLMSRGLEARSDGAQQAQQAAVAAAAAQQQQPNGVQPRVDPLRRTRSAAGRGSGRSGDMEAAAAQVVQQAGLAARAAAAAAANDGFRAPAPVPFPKIGFAGGASGTASLGRSISGRRRGSGIAAAGAALSIPMIEPTPLFERGFSEVLVTPTFSSQEIALLLDALKPKP